MSSASSVDIYQEARVLAKALIEVVQVPKASISFSHFVFRIVHMTSCVLMLFDRFQPFPPDTRRKTAAQVSQEVILGLYTIGVDLVLVIDWNAAAAFAALDRES